VSDHSPSHLARVKVQFWVPAEGAGEVERWRETAQAQGLELGPWLRGVANVAVDQVARERKTT
jgi:hypothetical protein